MNPETDPVRLALAALLEWGRDHTGPRDPNSPHLLLIAAEAALKTTDPDAMTLDESIAAVKAAKDRLQAAEVTMLRLGHHEIDVQLSNNVDPDDFMGSDGLLARFPNCTATRRLIQRVLDLVATNNS